MKKFLAASILAANPLCLEQEVLRLEKSGVDMLHVDIMDGHFVPNITFGANIVSALKKITKLPLDVHLMVKKPENHIQSFVNAGADMITVHMEATDHLDKVLRQIRSSGVKAGVALLPATSHHMLDFVLDIIDLVLVMSVNPGFGGQEFIPQQLEKINALSYKINPNTILSVDGGINDKTILLAAQKGANLLVSGSYIYQNQALEENVKHLRSVMSVWLDS